MAEKSDDSPFRVWLPILISTAALIVSILSYQSSRRAYEPELYVRAKIITPKGDEQPTLLVNVQNIGAQIQLTGAGFELPARATLTCNFKHIAESHGWSFPMNLERNQVLMTVMGPSDVAAVPADQRSQIMNFVVRTALGCYRADESVVKQFVAQAQAWRDRRHVPSE